MSELQGMEVIEQIARVLDALGISYAIGGSIASSLYGAARFTQDADITVEPFLPLADRFYDAIKNDFYVSEQALREALTTHRSFNIIHFGTAFKIDLFVQGHSEFEHQLLARSRKANLTSSTPTSLCFVSPEDIVLLKLRWFHEGGRISQRQWTDVLGVLCVQQRTLDYAYMSRCADGLGLAELLKEAITEAQASA